MLAQFDAFEERKGNCRLQWGRVDKRRVAGARSAGDAGSPSGTTFSTARATPFDGTVEVVNLRVLEYLKANSALTQGDEGVAIKPAFEQTWNRR